MSTNFRFEDCSKCLRLPCSSPGFPSSAAPPTDGAGVLAPGEGLHSSVKSLLGIILDISYRPRIGRNNMLVIL